MFELLDSRFFKSSSHIHVHDKFKYLLTVYYLFVMQSFPSIRVFSTRQKQHVISMRMHQYKNFSSYKISQRSKKDAKKTTPLVAKNSFNELIFLRALLSFKPFPVWIRCISITCWFIPNDLDPSKSLNGPQKARNHWRRQFWIIAVAS